MEPTLNKEQYEFLKEQKDQIESFVRVRYAPGLKLEWFRKLSDLYSKLFKSPPLDPYCMSCKCIAVDKAHRLLTEYEEYQKKLAEEQAKAEAEAVPDIKRKGRTPKNWIKEENV